MSKIINTNKNSGMNFVVLFVEETGGPGENH
jgi:hypothetical protein